jgi:hypothetical protein
VAWKLVSSTGPERCRVSMEADWEEETVNDYTTDYLSSNIGIREAIQTEGIEEMLMAISKEGAIRSKGASDYTVETADLLGGLYYYNKSILYS